jgi:hypothetical protein
MCTDLRLFDKPNTSNLTAAEILWNWENYDGTAVAVN